MLQPGTVAGSRLMPISALQSFITMGKNTKRNRLAAAPSVKQDTSHVVKSASDFTAFSFHHPLKIHFLQDFEKLQQERWKPVQSAQKKGQQVHLNNF